MSSYRTSHVGDGRGEQYDATHSGKVDAHIWDAFIKELLNEQFAESISSGATAYLDFACGTGRVLNLASKQFDDCTGIDISADMLEVARRRVPDANIIVGDVTEQGDLTSGRYDCVTLFRFLLNAERSLSIDVLKWLHEHMTNNAYLIGNNHMNVASIRGIATVFSNRLLGTQHNHLSRKQTTTMLEESGFRIVSWSGYRVLPTIKGRPIFGKALQIGIERMLRTLGFGRLGSEQVFVAKKV